MGYTRKKVNERLEDFQNLEFISDQNKEDFLDFMDRIVTDPNISELRAYKYVTNFKTIHKNFFPDKELRLKTADKDEVRKIAAEIQRSDYSGWSKHDYKVCIRKYFNTLYEDEFDRPKRVKKILNANYLSWSGEPENQNEIKALSPKEVKAMSEQAENARDKLIPLFFFESGARINEIRQVKLKDIDMNQKYAEVTFTTLKNDKGDRTLQLTRSVGLLQDWLEKHPNQDDSDSPLFVNIGSKYKGKLMSQKNIGDLLRRLKNEADIEKRVTAHVMRHSAATYYGIEKGWSVTRMKHWFGWLDDSMVSKYSKENEERLKRMRLQEEGIKVEEKEGSELERKECGRCGETWPPTQKYCGQCSLALDQESAQEAKELEESVENVAEERVNGLSEEEIAKKLEKLEEKVMKS